MYLKAIVFNFKGTDKDKSLYTTLDTLSKYSLLFFIDENEIKNLTYIKLYKIKSTATIELPVSKLPLASFLPN